MSIYVTPHMLDPARHPIEKGTRRNAIGRMFDRTVRDWRRRRMIAALDAMDDRILNDIGLQRGDIGRVVRTLDARELRMVPLAPPARRDQTEAESWKLAA